MEKKKKTRFFLIIGVLIVLTISSWMFMLRGLKETYRVLENDTSEVKSQLNTIKDYRKVKGYKVIKDENEYKMILISAGLTYGREDKIEVESVNFDSDEVLITVKETIDPAPEKETITYPYIIVKIDTSKDSFKVVNTKGEEYNPINLENPQDEITESNSQDSNDTIDSESTDNEDNIQDSSDENELDNDELDDEVSIDLEAENQESTPSINQVSVEYQGRIDDESIEVKIGNDYSTFYLSDEVKSKINNYDIGAKITLSYSEINGQRRVVGVN